MPFTISNAAIYNAIQALSVQTTRGFQNVTAQMGKIVSEIQTSIDNAVTVVGGLLADLGTDNQEILADITAIQQLIANGQPVDVTALDAIVAKVSGVQSGIDQATSALGAVAVPPTPPPVTPPAV